MFYCSLSRQPLPQELGIHGTIPQAQQRFRESGKLGPPGAEMHCTSFYFRAMPSALSAGQPGALEPQSDPGILDSKGRTRTGRVSTAAAPAIYDFLTGECAIFFFPEGARDWTPAAPSARLGRPPRLGAASIYLNRPIPRFEFHHREGLGSARGTVIGRRRYDGPESRRSGGPHPAAVGWPRAIERLAMIIYSAPVEKPATPSA